MKMPGAIGLRPPNAIPAGGPASAACAPSPSANAGRRETTMLNDKAELTKAQLELLVALAQAHIKDQMAHADTCPAFLPEPGDDATCNCGVEARYEFIYAAIAEAARVDPLNGFTAMSDHAPENRHAWYVTIEDGFPDTDRWVFFPFRNGGEWNWETLTNPTYYREIGPLPKMPKEGSNG